MDGDIRLEHLEKNVQKLQATESRLRRVEGLCALLLLANVFLVWAWLGSGSDRAPALAGSAGLEGGPVQVSIINASQSGPGTGTVNIRSSQISNSTFIATSGSTIDAE